MPPSGTMPRRWRWPPQTGLPSGDRDALTTPGWKVRADDGPRPELVLHGDTYDEPTWKPAA